MKNLLRLIGIKPNDWELVYSENGFWNVNVITDFGNYKEKDSCNFYIYYSKIRNKYKLTMDGYKPKKHHVYHWALNELIRLQRLIS